MNNFKKIISLAVIVIAGYTAKAQDAYGEIRGTIKDTDGIIPFATVKITQGTRLIGGTTSDENGIYKYKPLTAGIYEVTAIEPGHQTQPVNKVKVTPNKTTYVDVTMAINTLATVTVVAKAIEYVGGGVDKSMYSMTSIDAKDLLVHAGVERGNIKGALSSLSSEVYTDGNGDVYFRGSRGNATAYYIDGCRTLGPAQVSGLAVENLTFFSGGVPAMYGDLTGGAVIVTTKSYFSGLREKNIRNTEFREKQEVKKAEAKRLKMLQDTSAVILEK